MAPGLHLLSEGPDAARVVYWDPELLTRGAPPLAGVRGQALFAEVTGVDGGAGHRAQIEARRALDATAHAGSISVSSLRASGATLSVQHEVTTLPLGVVETPSARLALLVRSVLDGPLLTDPVRRSARLARRAAEIGGAAEEVAAAHRIAEAILRDPDLGPLAPTLRAQPLTGMVGARSMVEGEAFVTELSEALGAALVIDVHATPEPLAAVQARLAIAADVHQRATGRPAQAVLFTLEAE